MATSNHGRSESNSLLHWAVPLVAGAAIVLVAFQLGNPLILVGTGELFTALALGALLRAHPWRIGLLLVLPALAYHLGFRTEDWIDLVVAFGLYSAFAVFNGAAAGAGMDWATDLRSKPGRK